MQKGKGRNDLADQIVGELVLYVPLVAAAAFSGIAKHVLLAMATFCACKWFYQAKQMFHVKTGICVCISYGLFLVIGFCTLGISKSSLFMRNQPMLPILFSIGATWFFSHAGEWQYGYMQWRDREAFSCATASAEAIRARALLFGIKDEDIDFIIRAHRTSTRRKEFAAEFGVSEGAIKKRKKRLTERLESCN